MRRHHSVGCSTGRRVTPPSARLTCTHIAAIIDTVGRVCRGRVYETVGRPSVRLSVTSLGRCTPLRRVCCRGNGGQEIYRSTAAAAARRSAANCACSAAMRYPNGRRAAANARSVTLSAVTLSADLGSCKQACKLLFQKLNCLKRFVSGYIPPPKRQISKQ